MSVIQTIDNLDDRREIFYLFSCLESSDRVGYLQLVIDSLWEHGRLTRYIVAANQTGKPEESFIDFMTLISQYGLPIKELLASLEVWVSTRTDPKRRLERLAVSLPPELHLAIEGRCRVSGEEPSDKG